MPAYKILYADEVLDKDIPALPKAMKLRIKQAIEAKLTIDPISYGKPLQYALKGHRRLRVGDWRVVYRIENCLVRIIGIQHRSKIYD